jgi:hypothetical protein
VKRQGARRGLPLGLGVSLLLTKAAAFRYVRRVVRAHPRSDTHMLDVRTSTLEELIRYALDHDLVEEVERYGRVVRVPLQQGHAVVYTEAEALAFFQRLIQASVDNPA